MSKQSKRRNLSRMIRANANTERPIHAAASPVEWIVAAEGDKPEAPKKFSMTAYTGGPMVVGYYGAPVVIDLAGLTAKAPLPILMHHDPRCIVGHADSIEVSGSDIKLSGLVSGAGPEAAQVTASAASGFPWKASVGARPDKLEFVGEGVETRVNGKVFKGPLYVARKATLGEVSFVPMAADGKTSAKVAASAANPSGGSEMNPFEKWVQALGFNLADLTDAQKANLQAKFDAEAKNVAVNAGAVVPVPKFDLSGVVLAYEKHVATVQAKSAGYVGKIDSDKLSEIQAAAQTKAAELKAQALNEEKPAAWLEVELVKAQAAAEVELIRAERPKAPAMHGSNRDVQPAVIEAAFSRSAGLQSPDKVYKPEVLEAADRQFRNLGLCELLLIHACQNGYTGRMRIGTDNLREVMRAAFSTHSLTTMLSTVGNKILWEGFNSIPQRWRMVAGTRTVSDFKAVTAYRMTTSLEYEEVGPTGEIKHGEAGQESYSLQAKTYAKMLSLTRADIINDDLGAFNELRAKLGLGSIAKMEKVFWTAWLAARNAGTFWTAARGNLVTGSALAEAGLNTAVQAFRDMKGPDGFRVGVAPKFVLVPTALEATAKKWYSSTEVRDTTSSTKFPTANIYQGQFEPIAVPELGDSSFTGYSATTWHLLADPRQLASAVMCFLNGQESPTIESAEADFDTLGMDFRGYHDFGVGMSEWMASVQANA